MAKKKIICEAPSCSYSRRYLLRERTPELTLRRPEYQHITGNLTSQIYYLVIALLILVVASNLLEKVAHLED
jgi:hypothetical protein